jgi:hypothetical protein
MTRPTDHPSGHEDGSLEKRFKLREGCVKKPLFREVSVEEIVQPAGRASKRFVNPLDRKNLLYVLAAVIVAMVILVLLEMKQIRDAAAEKEQQTNTTVQSN